MNVKQAIRKAEELLPGAAAPDGQIDPRWQAIIEVGEFVEDEPEAVWAFVRRWGTYPDEDLSAAIATCLLEHLLEYHFQALFGRVERLVRENKQFADTFSRCAKFGESEAPGNSAAFDELMAVAWGRPK